MGPSSRLASCQGSVEITRKQSSPHRRRWCRGDEYVYGSADGGKVTGREALRHTNRRRSTINANSCAHAMNIHACMQMLLAHLLASPWLAHVLMATCAHLYSLGYGAYNVSYSIFFSRGSPTLSDSPRASVLHGVLPTPTHPHHAAAPHKQPTSFYQRRSVAGTLGGTIDWTTGLDVSTPPTPKQFASDGQKKHEQELATTLPGHSLCIPLVFC